MIFGEDILVMTPENETLEERQSELRNFIGMSQNYTILHVYSRYCNESRMQELLSEGNHDINAQDSLGRTPLMWAVKSRNAYAMKALLEAGADMFIFSQDNRSALDMFFSDTGMQIINHITFLDELKNRCSTREEIIRRITDAGCNLYQAVFLKDAKIIEYLITQGYSVNSMHLASKQTALHAAVLLEDIETVKVLLKYGVNHEALDKNGLNVLAYLYRFNIENIPYGSIEKVELLKILLNAGVSATTCIAKSVFQIGFLLGGGNSEVIRVVLQSNINFAAKDRTRRNILHYLATNTNPKVSEELEQHIDKFKINRLEKTLGHSPLQTALSYANVDMVKFFLKHGARVNIVDCRGFTPLYISCNRLKTRIESENVQCLQLLLQHNADPQFVIPKKNGRLTTIFDYSLKNHCLRRIKLVLAHLAMLEGIGTPITDVIHSKISSDHTLNKHFQRFQQILQKKILGSTTLLNLLTDNKTKMAQHSCNKKLMLKLKRISCRRKVKFSFLYYYNTLKMRLEQGFLRKKLQDCAATVICKIFKDFSITEEHLIMNQLFSYMSDKDLWQLCHLY